MKEDKISVDLNKAEAELFIIFRKYQDIWEKILQTKGGKVVLHFDSNGKIRQVDSDHILYKA